MKHKYGSMTSTSAFINAYGIFTNLLQDAGKVARKSKKPDLFIFHIYLSNFTFSACFHLPLLLLVLEELTPVLRYPETCHL